ncbi:MAG: NAD(P)-dependent glycerol-3-phosphate dehydrogenase [Victivallaceae bacterium]|nr:NAD(P)-dependent glycerol-3-phosphate dehydrogenase [Victivallaceae bacterium]
MKIAILSDGGWGTALATVLAANSHEVTLWGPFPDYIEEMKQSRQNTRFLKNVQLPEQLKLESDIAKAAEADYLVLAAPVQYMRGVLSTLKPYYEPRRHRLIDVAKGIECETLLRVSGICAEVLGECRYSVMSGPSHAEEVSRGVPTAVVAASEENALAEEVQELFMNHYFRVYTSSDCTGVELGGALKNVMAIAAGIIDGMKLGDNPKAAMMTRGIAEMSRLGVALGGEAQTFSGLSGIGDLIVTCCSGHSRNRHVGEELGRGLKIDEITSAMGMVVAEGVKTTRSTRELACKLNLEAPIVEQVHAIIYDGKNPSEAVAELMGRKAKPELE